jgi:hypothetical protein
VNGRQDKEGEDVPKLRFVEVGEEDVFEARTQ